MPVGAPQSATSVGKKPAAAGLAKRPIGARSAPASTVSKAGGVKKASAPANSAGSLNFWQSDQALGPKVGPVTVLLMCLGFIAGVFVLHIWGKLAS